MKRIEVFECQYCRRLYRREWQGKQHEAICWKNKNRTPQLGEIVGVDEFEFDDNDKLVPRAPWVPNEPGQIWVGEHWLPVPGYKVGYAGDDYEGYFGAEEWPPVDEYYVSGIAVECPLDKWELNLNGWGNSRWEQFVYWQSLDWTQAPWPAHLNQLYEERGVTAFTEALNVYLRDKE